MEKEKLVAKDAGELVTGSRKRSGRPNTALPVLSGQSWVRLMPSFRQAASPKKVMLAAAPAAGGRREREKTKEKGRSNKKRILGAISPGLYRLLAGEGEGLYIDADRSLRFRRRFFSFSFLKYFVSINLHFRNAGMISVAGVN